MPINETLLTELEHEASSTKKMLERVPAEKFDWKPHEKSFSLGRLAAHVAELHSWVGFTVNHDELDLATMNYKPAEVHTSSDLMKLFEDQLSQAKQDIQNVSDETMMKAWTLRNKDQVYFSMPKIAVLRSMVVKHIVHHRAQLSVYLRLLDIPVPGMYGPTADER